ncbi:SRPBCC family protein [Pseudonocardia sp. NPDC049635]|uniref:SRPBCC family protein n=1 Tax=Pseudonocardia sp. NPDC049635 TaxID=3155506 RepID=UPI0033C6D675
MSGPAGEVRTGPDGRRVLAFRREFPDPVEDVWAAVTDPTRCARWFGTWTGDARPGGTVALSLTSEEDGGGPPSEALITECEPPHRLTVRIAEDDGPAWELAVSLHASGSGTVLRFEQVLPDSFDPADAGPGWHWYLDRLAAVLSGGPMPDWEATLAATAQYYRTERPH